MPNELSIASFNIHAGVDGWSRPFDVVEACRRIDADVLIIEENLADDAGSSIASAVGTALGYEVTEVPFITIEMTVPFAPSVDEPRWGPPGLRPQVRALRYPDRGSPPWRRTTAAERELESTRVSIGLAVLARIDHRATVIGLPSLLGDPSRRSLILLDLPLRSGSIHIGGTHLGHLTHGSIRQMRALHRALPHDVPTVLGGDMNCWGPLLQTQLPGMRRAVRGPTWPAWRARHQIDHLLISEGVECVTGSVLPPFGSDHLAVRCVVRVADPWIEPSGGPRID